MRRSSFHKEEDYVLRMRKPRRQLRSGRRFRIGVGRLQTGACVTTQEVGQCEPAKTSTAFQQHISPVKHRFNMRHEIYLGKS